jgi:hypothetical protein
MAGAGGGPTGTGGSPAGTGGGGDAGHNGGAQGGHSADGGETCAEIDTAYSNALAAARQCTPGAANQCQQLVATSLSCPGCKEYVNDVTTLNSLAGTWNDQDCGSIPHACPAIYCVNPRTSSCVASGGGPAECRNGLVMQN